VTAVAPTLDDVTLRVREIIAELLQVDLSDVHSDAALLNTGASESLDLDSLDALKLALALVEEYGLAEPTELDIHEARTVGDAAVLVYRLACG
jgi:acyl carrier protein